MHYSGIIRIFAIAAGIATYYVSQSHGNGWLASTLLSIAAFLLLPVFIGIAIGIQDRRCLNQQIRKQGFGQASQRKDG